jgi:hypothetical protein
VSQQDVADAYSDAVWHAENIFFNAHGVAKFLLSHAVRDAGIKVVFTGEGADEILGGYAPFRRDMLLYNSEKQDPAETRRLLDAMEASNRAFPGLIVQEGQVIPELAGLSRGSRPRPRAPRGCGRSCATISWRSGHASIPSSQRSTICRRSAGSPVAIPSTRPSTCGAGSTCPTTY